MRRLTWIAAAACLACSDEAPPSSALTETYHAPKPVPLSCVPTLDGTIQASQFQPVLGVPANYLVSPAGESRTVDLIPQVNASGQNVWDFSAKDSTDQLASVEANSLEGKWYASSFPNGTFVVPLDLADTEEGVYSFAGETMWLYGYASTQQNPSNGMTLLVYDQPILAYQFPLQVGSNWISTATATGTIEGLSPYAQTDTYTFTVDAAGVLELPELSFTQVLRLRSQVTSAPAFGSPPVTTRQTSLLFQCFGEVYRATSQPGETSDNFSNAAQVRRFSLQTQP
jgi:hypothetical protein